MEHNVYRIYCYVDDGCRHARYKIHVCAHSQKEAIDLVKHYWNSQYDTTVEIKAIETMPLEDYKVLCVQEE